MASYTSVQSGNWNNPATWGGGGYPSVAGDTATIAAGHTVTYNVSSTVQLGDITLNGLLKFREDLNTKLTLGHNDITVNAGGELRIGDNTTPIGSDFTAELIWNTTSDNAKGINLATATSKLTIYGSPNYFGSDFATHLYADWSSGTNIQVEGDYATKWKAGQILLIHKGRDYVTTTDVHEAVISGTPTYDGTKTSMTLTATHPGGTSFLAGGRVLNMSRNVVLYKSGYATAIGNFNSNRPRILGLYQTASGNINIHNALFGGFYRLYNHYQICRNIVLRNGYRTIGGTQIDLSDIIFFSVSSALHNATSSTIPLKNSYCVSSTRCHEYNVFIDLENCEIFGGTGTSTDSALGDYTVSNICKDCFFYGLYIFGNAFGAKLVDCVIGKNRKGLVSRNSTDFNLTTYNNHDYLLMNCDVPNTGLTISRNSGGRFGRVRCEHYGRSLDDHRIYDAFGDLIKTPADGADDNPAPRAGGAADVIEVVPQSNCSAENYLEILRHRIWAAPGVAKTYRYHVQSSYTAALTVAELALSADWLDGVTGGSRTTTASTSAVAARTDQDDWSQYLEVTITPAEEGWMDLVVTLKTYETGAKLWVDPKVQLI